MWCSRPVPRVSVRNSVRKPMSPRAGTMNSIRTHPVPWLVICSMRPLRTARSWAIAPRYSSGASIVSRSTGSGGSPRAPSAARAPGGGLGDRAEVLLRGVDRQPLHRLVQLAVDLLGDHLRLADGELVA